MRFGFLTCVLASNGATTRIDQTCTRNSKGLITVFVSPDASRPLTYRCDAQGGLTTADNANGSGDDRSYPYDCASGHTSMIFLISRS